MKRHEFAIYKGDELLVMGTSEECAKALGIKPASVTFLTTPAYARRVAARKRPERAITGVKLGRVKQ